MILMWVRLFNDIEVHSTSHDISLQSVALNELSTDLVQATGTHMHSYIGHSTGRVYPSRVRVYTRAGAGTGVL